MKLKAFLAVKSGWRIVGIYWQFGTLVILLIVSSLVYPILGLQSAQKYLSYGTVIIKEILIEWSISTRLGITDPDYAINISKFIGATAVLLIIDVAELDINRISQYVEKYRENNFSVYISVSATRLLTPNDIDSLLNLDIRGIAVNIFGTYNLTEAELSLIQLANTSRIAGKLFAYYHGDGLSNVNATKLASKGCIIWAWWTGSWKPKTWNLPAIWAQQCIWDRDGKYSTPTDIINWYNTLPQTPDALVFWLTTCLHNPTEEQKQAMKTVSMAFMQAK